MRTTLRSILASLAVLVSLLAVSPASAAPWPGNSAVSNADGANVLGANLSGLAYQPSGTAAPGVLWAVKNEPPTLYRLVWNGTIWTPDTANEWGVGKLLKYTTGLGVPDAEGVTLASDDPNAVYVSAERDDQGGGSPSRPSILRYDVSAAGTTLTATDELNLTADLPGLGGNAGLEGVAWVPDTFLVSKGFKEILGATYNPASYPGHGTGLFFVAVEDTGQIVAYALNRTTDTFTRVAAFASGHPELEVMEITYDPEGGRLWAACDDHCAGRITTLEIASSGPSAGTFVVTNTYDRPAGMGNLNTEGFAIAPQAECVNSLKPVFFADDDGTGTHALRAGTVSCTSGTPPSGGGGGGGGGQSGGGGSQPPESDTKVDGSASIAKSQKQKGSQITVKLTVTGAEALTAEATGKVKVGKKSYALKPASKSVPAGGSAAVKLKPKGKGAAAIAAVIAEGKKPKASVSVTLKDAAGNKSTKSLSTKLTG